VAFLYHENRLKIGTAGHHHDVQGLVARLTSDMGTPTYLYDLDNISLRYQAFSKAFEGLNLAVHYAMKANHQTDIVSLLARAGAGADTVSAGEIQIALQNGIPASKIIFSGVGKTTTELTFAIRQQIKQINVESPQELERISQLTEKLGLSIDVAFRMNPDVNPKTHPYITTGFRENKFGMDNSFLPELERILAQSSGRIRLRGLTLHIGSQLLELSSLREAIEKTLIIYKELENRGHQLDRFDIGGGLGINYESDDESSEFEMLREYGAMVRSCFTGMKVEILTEPGRILVARAGLLISEVQYIKTSPAKTFVILNTGMHHLLRPALYGAHHRILPLKLTSQPEIKAALYDIVGPICESSDVLARNIALNSVQQGDFIGLADSGAYGYTMASHYNAHALPIEIAVSASAIATDELPPLNDVNEKY
jgi:diaminopimelate decarboxylase